MYTLKNDNITLQVSEMGAEMKSLKKNEKEYLWNGDPKFWGRTAPVLFPLVGSLKNKQYSYNGQSYTMGQHGFARDMEFELVEQTNNSIRFRLNDDEETRKVYPFHFQLEIEYVIRAQAVMVKWMVKNTDDKDIYFSIGGHPAFMCPFDGEGQQTEYSLEITHMRRLVDRLERTVLGEGGLAQVQKETIELQDGILPVTAELFDRDALIFEDCQMHGVALHNPEGEEYLRVEFDAPVVGIWSPAGKNAPFVCIEPWYGRCDREDFAGSLEQREWGNHLSPEAVFEKEFLIRL